MFDMMVGRFPSLTRLVQFDMNREYKIKKMTGNKGYEFYFTGTDSGVGQQLVNFMFLFSQVGNDWLVDDLEITAK